jgi:hypothetical protein
LGFGIWDLGFGILDFGFGIGDWGLGIYQQWLWFINFNLFYPESRSPTKNCIAFFQLNK